MGWIVLAWNAYAEIFTSTGLEYDAVDSSTVVPSEESCWK